MRMCGTAATLRDSANYRDVADNRGEVRVS